MKPIFFLSFFIASSAAIAEPAPPYEQEEVRMLCEEWAEAEEVSASEHSEFLARCMQEELEARGYYDEQTSDDQLEMEGEGDEPYPEEIELNEPAPEAQ